jgi:flagellar protein FlaG
VEVSNNISKTTYTDNTVDYGKKQNITSDISLRDTREFQSKEVVINSGGIMIGDSKKSIGVIPDDVAKAVISEINKKINRNTTAHFAYHEKTNRVMIKITDSETNEIIKEIPPEKTLDMIAKIWELAGILVDDKR